MGDFAKRYGFRDRPLRIRFRVLDPAHALLPPRDEAQDITLDAEERSLYDDLRDNRLRKGVRLEQEKIGFAWVESALKALL